jgi:transcriptional regulator with XRE-family HTH domain
MREAFDSVLRSFRERSGRSRNNLAHEVGVDPSYLTRIEHGDRDAPRLHIVEALARALRLSINDRNQLLVAAGYAPVDLGTLGWPAALQSVADVLTSVHLTPEERDTFSNVIQQISARWVGAPAQDRVTNGAHP